MTLGCTSRSIAAALVIGSLKIPSHWENGRWLVMSTRPASYRSASSVNSTSLSKAALLHIPQVIDQQRLEAAQLPPVAGQLQLPLGHQQLLHQQAAGRIPHPPPLFHQRVAEAAQQVRFPTAGMPKGEHVLPPRQEAAVQQRRQLQPDLGRQPALLEALQPLGRRQPCLLPQA